MGRCMNKNSAVIYAWGGVSCVTCGEEAWKNGVEAFCGIRRRRGLSSGGMSWRSKGGVGRACRGLFVIENTPGPWRTRRFTWLAEQPLKGGTAAIPAILQPKRDRTAGRDGDSTTGAAPGPPRLPLQAVACHCLQTEVAGPRNRCSSKHYQTPDIASRQAGFRPRSIQLSFQTSESGPGQISDTSLAIR